MKLNPRDAGSFFTRPDTSRSGILIHGQDAMRVALKRQDLIRALIGPNGAEEMRLERMSGSDLRRDPARLDDAIKAQGFFPGQRVVLVEDATDGLAKLMEQALSSWQKGDAMLVVTAGQLNARSALRKLFEGDRQALAAAIYTDPASREELEAELVRAGIREVPPAAMNDLMALGRVLDPGDFRQTLEKLALFKLGDESPLTGEDIAAVAPQDADADIDDVIHMVAEGSVATLGDALARLGGQGTNPTTLCIALMRHFRLLYAAASDPQGPESALSRARPPVFGPRRDRMVRQARGWGVMRLEPVLALITDTDLSLRSARPLPGMAVVERLLIRIAMQHGR
ncbi:DNA polymerase III subunit delta [Algicella marina]|uniref:DNA-directed DNA polymerase n=1 Tax=Algicella marina TaxID=2683284 RepID=A0A6P1T4H7_9RHOB|nr:DNA polymerase III subunit delta [Algicella marina]QHQ36610.1 DNA polymerase III subunit delta [Algicella marina]